MTGEDQEGFLEEVLSETGLSCLYPFLEGSGVMPFLSFCDIKIRFWLRFVSYNIMCFKTISGAMFSLRTFDNFLG